MNIFLNAQISSIIWILLNIRLQIRASVDFFLNDALSLKLDSFVI